LRVAYKECADAARTAEQLLVERYRCPEALGEFVAGGTVSANSGYFRFGSDTVCFGQCASGVPAKFVTEALHDARDHVMLDGGTVQLPFDPAQVLDNLRYERYGIASPKAKTLPANGFFRGLYYLARPLLGVSVRKHLQRRYFRGWEKIPFPQWPVDSTVENLLDELLLLSMQSRNIERIPFIWFWPDGARSCAMLTHDVETQAGRDYCAQLMDINDSFGIKSSFQIVPEKRYSVPPYYLERIQRRGFEVNVHDLNHDGRLMCDREEFLRRAERINHYGRQFGALGFRSAVMYRNGDWYDALDFSYDMSMPNVAHLDPQQGGCCTVMPYFIGKILELPLTTIQDYSLFNILGDYSTRLWKEQIALLRSKHGLMSFLIHPDYIIDRAARRIYVELLQCLSALRAEQEIWLALPSEVDTWWRTRNELNLVDAGGSWRIQGKGCERARLAYACRVNGKLTYQIDPAPHPAD